MFLWHSLLYVQPSSSLAISLALNLGQSFLGMNIAESSMPFSTKYNTTSSSSSAACSNSASESCSPRSANPQLWNMSAFGILSGCIFFVTLGVPFIFGPISRWLLRSWFPRLMFLLQFTMMLTVVTILAVFPKNT